MSKYKLTGLIKINDFPKFLASELQEPRHNIQKFSLELAQLFEVNYLSLVNSGSSANFVAALTVKEVNPNRNKILISAFSFPTTVSSFTLLGFNVKLIDINNNDFNISVDEILNHIDSHTAAVVVTHFLGFPAALEKIKKVCKTYGALLIQDACETMNLKILNKPIHAFGDIVTHSFYHPHHLSSYGGGAISTNNEKIFKIADSIIHWGRMCQCHINANECTAPQGINHHFFYAREGLNVEISELNACFGRYQLKQYDQYEKTRKNNYLILYNTFKKFKFLEIYPDIYNLSPFAFPVKVLTDNFDEIVQDILQHSIEIRNLMGGYIGNQPAFKFLNHDNLAHAKQASKKTFFLGIHQSINEADFLSMVQLLNNRLKKYV